MSFASRPISTLDLNTDDLNELLNNEDIVNSPQHYISERGIETIDVIEAFTKDLEPFEAYCTGNIIKYICRWKHKNGKEDLKKARWYINRLLGENKKIEDHIIEVNAHYHNIADPSSGWTRIVGGVYVKDDYITINLSDVDWDEDVLEIYIDTNNVDIFNKHSDTITLKPPF